MSPFRSRSEPYTIQPSNCLPEGAHSSLSNNSGSSFINNSVSPFAYTASGRLLGAPYPTESTGGSMTPLREKMVRDMQLRRLSDNTQRVYLHAVFALARHYMQAPDLLNDRQIQDYVLYMLNVRKLTWSTCDTNVAGLQFFYGATLGRNSMRLVRSEERRA